MFDVFGTLVDWRSSIVRDLEAFGARRGLGCDWAALVDAWRAAYPASLDAVRSGRRPWAVLDVLHGESFDTLAVRFGLPPFEPSERAWIVERWHALDPWPDVRTGLELLRQRHVLATLSNGNVSLLVDLARHGDLRFDTILSAELFAHYKPDPEAYLGACALLGRSPDEVMMVAAHPHDLAAARSLGLRTAFVSRPAEYGPGRNPDAVSASEVDVVAHGLDDLARQLEATAS